MRDDRTEMAERAAIGIRKKLAFGVIPLAVVLVLAEGALRLIDYRSPIEDPYESFVAKRPVFERRGDLMVVSPARQGSFHPASFAVEKPPGLVRGFVVGGSTTYGSFLENPAADCYAGVMQRLLADRLQRPVEVINCGAGAYASYRLTQIVEEIVHYAPDFIVVMTGHNEFLEPIHYANLIEKKKVPWYLRLRVMIALRTLRERARPVFRLPAVHEPVVSLEPFEKYIVRNETEIAYALDHYRRNLDRMVEAGMEKGVPVFLSTTTCNLRDFAPFYSMSWKIPPDELRSRLAVVEGFLADGRHEEALAEARAVLSVDGAVAVFHFVAAKALEGLGRYAEAKESYVMARDTDRFPHRALSSFNEAVREIIRRRKLPLFDAEGLFEDASEHGIPGANLFLDNCHPTAAGHRLLGEAFAGQIADYLTNAGAPGIRRG